MASMESAHSQGDAHGSLRSYTIGFLCSIVLTVIPAAIVLGGWLDGSSKTYSLMAAGVLQLAVQLLFFMHVREEKKPRYNLLALILGLVILIVIVGGSMWVMMYNMVAS
ncbi:cytochrome C oxidase subunit IV family protein [Paenibacillus sp. MWE-103]|uniref:Cytochrome C oxidase subunit IV family protein n=2 Tax=Paenibacillus artemisiicola TaxID=1172618 RepID=A0ABS3W570_9BACL|nr:cytochrome C oxidase subunit IV family protein [Paenibacillus artemisiicola]MBO7743457.1 cytochrome C oxidase subunit IV family protein [Paenibacillus artemisiicola]